MTGLSRARSFFDEAQAAFERARNAASWRSRDYGIAGCHIQIVATTAFHAVHRALTHLEALSPLPPSLVIYAWDSVSTGIRMPSPPWSTNDYGARGEIAGFNGEFFRTAFDLNSDALSMLDLERNIGLFWTRDASTLPSSERGAPLKTLFNWWMEKQDRLFLHAGAVGTENAAVLLAGEGGAGKSTTALLCLDRGLNYLSDDYCIVAPGNPARVFSLYGTGKIAADEIARFPLIAASKGVTYPEGEEKLLIYLKDEMDETRVLHLPLRAILIPRITASAERTSIEPGTAADALKALAPSTISQLSGTGAATFYRLSELARATPCYHLVLARDYGNIPKKIREFIETLSP